LDHALWLGSGQSPTEKSPPRHRLDRSRRATVRLFNHDGRTSGSGLQCNVGKPLNQLVLSHRSDVQRGVGYDEARLCPEPPGTLDHG
jgi:hypothetical protein